MEYFSEEEKEKLKSFNKIIIWGFPLNTHTHSYIHAMWVKAFKYLGKDTYWFHDSDYSKDFNYENSLFITEGYADANIPILKSCTYFVHFCINPKKYLNVGCRLIEIRFNVDEMHDCNMDFNLNDGSHNLISLSEETRYEKLVSDKDLNPNKRNNSISLLDYEAIYLHWATDLLPHEFDEMDIEKPKSKNIIHYIGSPHNSRNFNTFIQICRKNRIKIIFSNPWNSPKSFQETKELMQKSVISPDFRPTGTQNDINEYGIKNGKNHLEIGYLPCRVLKTISYGRIGVTDSKRVKEILGEHVIYSDNMRELFNLAMREKDNKEMIKKSMKHVKEHHTYIQRVRDLMRCLIK